jgi:hypothetical protein
MTACMTERVTETRVDDDELDGKLKRDITGPLLFLFILGDVLGAGIYALMGVLSQDIGGALWAPLLVALLLALLTAGSYAELVTKYPKAVWPWPSPMTTCAPSSTCPRCQRPWCSWCWSPA